MSVRVTRSRSLVAKGYPTATVARCLRVSRQALYRVPRPRTSRVRRAPSGPIEAAIVETARANPTDGYRMVTALVRRQGLVANRKRVLRVMREQRLIQRRRPSGRRRRPGHFTVSRPHQLWHLDMTSIWVAEHGWTYLHAAIDCCTRQISAWSLDLRARAVEAEQLIAGAVVERGIRPGSLTLGTTTARPSPPAASEPAWPAWA